MRFLYVAMIDIHCHIIPNVDDGACSLEESVGMARLAVADGIKEIVATPHTLDGVNENPVSEVLAAVNQLRKVFAAEDIPLKVHPGCEIHVTTGISRKIELREVCTLNDGGKYALLELPSQSIPPRMKTEIFELKLNGITPIIAHPERNVPMQNNPDLLLEMLRVGALAQLTTTSLLGDFGPFVQDLAKFFLKHRLVQLMASDAHSADNRPPQLSQAVEEAAEILESFREAESMVTSRPAAVLAGEEVIYPQPLTHKYQPRWNTFSVFARLWRTCFHAR